MGIEWLMADRVNRSYLKLGKPGEWSNELWRVWPFMVDVSWYDGEIIIIDTENDKYYEIIESEDWVEVYTDFTIEDADTLFYNAHDLISGAKKALDLYYFKLEIDDSEKHDRVGE